MSSIILVFQKLDDAKNIKSFLVRSGFRVDGIFTSGAQAVSFADELRNGVIVCGYRVSDMIYRDLYEDMPENFDLLLMASPKNLEDAPSDLVCLSMPIKLNDLTGTLTMMMQEQLRRRKKKRLQPKTRNEEERKVIEEAKSVLMMRNHLSEEDAHRYLQKCSMNNGTNLVESAQMVLQMMQAK